MPGSGTAAPKPFLPSDIAPVGDPTGERRFVMSDDNIFACLIRRLRGGDPRAAEELVREYEPAIRLEVHCRLRDPRLRRAFDSLDVCQSVLASFFVRAAA